MRIGICDDCEEDLKLLTDICNQNGHTDIRLYHSGEELLEDPDCSKLELLFLDIEMDGQSGLEVKDILEHTNTFTLIVFCTSHTEFVMDAFGQNVISFLTKPFTNLTVERCLKKALHLRKDYCPISISADVILPCCDILYIHAAEKYSVFLSTTNHTFLSRKSLLEWQKELSTLGFYSISRAYVVNLKHVKAIEGTTLFLTNQIELKISRRFITKFQKVYEQYRIGAMRYMV